MTVATAPSARPAAASPTTPRSSSSAQSFIADFAGLRRRLRTKNYIIVMLTVALLIALPLSKPIWLYYGMDENSNTMRLTGLAEPNLTNSAILSWSTTSIIEIMTIGFGDMDVRLPRQKMRFTSAGWDAFVKSFNESKIGEMFKQNQLVLTTVPSNTPVIVAQGVNPDRVYQWNVQMPVIMTYATNNNITRKERATVTLHLVRVPSEQNPWGIGIKNWLFN